MVYNFEILIGLLLVARVHGLLLVAILSNEYCNSDEHFDSSNIKSNLE